MCEVEVRPRDVQALERGGCDRKPVLAPDSVRWKDSDAAGDGRSAAADFRASAADVEWVLDLVRSVASLVHAARAAPRRHVRQHDGDAHVRGRGLGGAIRPQHGHLGAAAPRDRGLGARSPRRRHHQRNGTRCRAHGSHPRRPRHPHLLIVWRICHVQWRNSLSIVVAGVGEGHRDRSLQRQSGRVEHVSGHSVVDAAVLMVEVCRCRARVAAPPPTRAASRRRQKGGVPKFTF
jgi:hypothetical protein